MFSFEPGLAVWTWITFGILLLVMAKFVFPVLYGNIRDREKAIAKAVDDAGEISRRLDAVEAEQKKIVERARQEADRVLRQTRQEADALKKELAARAEAEAAAILADARERMAEERERAVDGIRKELADLVCDASEKVIGRSFVEDKDRDWTRELVDSL